MPRWNNPKYFHQAKPLCAEVALALANNPAAKTADLEKTLTGCRNTRIQAINRIRQEAGVAVIAYGRHGKFGVVNEIMFREFCETLGVTPKPGEVHPEMQNVCGVKGCWRLASKAGKPCYAHYYLVARHPDLLSSSPPDSSLPDSSPPDSSLPDSSPPDFPTLWNLLRRVQTIMRAEQIDRISVFASGEVEVDRMIKRRTKSKI